MSNCKESIVTHTENETCTKDQCGVVCATSGVLILCCWYVLFPFICLEHSYTISHTQAMFRTICTVYSSIFVCFVRHTCPNSRLLPWNQARHA